MKREKQTQKTKRNALAIAALALSAAAGSAHAADNVKYVDVTSGDGIFINDGKVIVEPVNGVYANVTSGNTVTFHRRLKAECKSNKVLRRTRIYYGVVPVSGGVLESNDLYYENVPHLYAGSIPYTQAELNVPLNKLGFNPVQVCKDMLANKMQQGSTKMQVMNQDQTVNRNISFSGLASCARHSAADIKYHERDVIGGTMKVICKAGSSGINQIAKPKGPITAVPLGGQGGFQAGHQPLQITHGQILTNQLHGSGTCPANLQFQVGYKGHGKGHLRYTIVQGGVAIHTSPELAYDGAQGWKQHAFNYQMQLDPQKTWELVGKEVKRNFSLQIEVKDEKADKFDWSTHNYNGLSWYYTCTPKLNPQLGNQPNGIGYGAQQPTPKTPSNIKAQPVGPTPPAPSRLKQAPSPVDPKPAVPTPSNIKANPVGPTPPAPSRLKQAPSPVDPKPAVPAPSNIKAQPVGPTPPAPTKPIRAVPVDPEPAPQPKRAQ